MLLAFKGVQVQVPVPPASSPTAQGAGPGMPGVGGHTDAQLATLQALGVTWPGRASQGRGLPSGSVSRGTPPKPSHWLRTVSHPSPPHEPVSAARVGGV